jgi:quinol monooxygenase YgiN
MTMWIQIIKTRLKPGKDAELAALADQLKAIEQPGSGLVRSTATRDQKDPNTIYMIVTFESEEKARAREQDERRQDGLQAVRETMALIFDGPPEFIDLEVISEHSGT